MIRVGIGYDIHRLVAGRRLVLGGVHIEHPRGLEGHSDADVLLHAIMDAVLGAVSLPDIGHLFPPGDERWRDVSSRVMLDLVRRYVQDEGYRVVNVDAVVIAEEPKLAPYRDEMRQAIAGCLRINFGAVGIKATTNESVGPEGRGEAISAHAVALLERTE